MDYDLALTSVLVVMLVIVATAKSALDEISDFALRRLASESEGQSHAAFISVITANSRRFNFTLTFGLHLLIASIAILITTMTFRRITEQFLLIAFLVMVVALILFRLVVPLLLTQNDPGQALIRLRWPLRIIYPALAFVAHPIYRTLRGWQKEETSETETAQEEESTEEQIQALLDVGEEEGIIHEDEGEMIQSVIRFSNRTVDEVMTPRPEVVAVAADAPLETVRDTMIASKYSRLPVFRDEPDNIEGVIYVRDLLTHWATGQTGQTAIALARPVFCVPETKPTDELLREMQKARTPMAIVIDEYGGLAGLITMEDLIEEIVGEIEDEDEPEPQEEEVEITQESSDCYVVRGSVEVGKVERLFDVELAADDFTTTAGLVINQLGHLPTVGEETEFRGLCFAVLEADDRRVSRVRIRRLSESPSEAEKTVTATSATRKESK